MLKYLVFQKKKSKLAKANLEKNIRVVVKKYMKEIIGESLQSRSLELVMPWDKLTLTKGLIIPFRFSDNKPSIDWDQFRPNLKLSVNHNLKTYNHLYTNGLNFQAWSNFLLVLIIDVSIVFCSENFNTLSTKQDSWYARI